jgi:hypothetical protein
MQLRYAPGDRPIRSKPRFLAFDTLIARIGAAPSAADLAALLETARAYFKGTQRERLEAAVAKRDAELRDSSGSGGRSHSTD